MTRTPEAASTPLHTRPRMPAAVLPAALLVAAAGVWALLLVGGAGGPDRVPPGAVLLPLAAVLTALVRRGWTAAVAAPVAAFTLLNALQAVAAGAGPGAGPDVVTPGRVVVLVGSAVALAACALRLLQRPARPGHGKGTRWQVAVLAVLAPVSAEYLSAYAETTGDPVQLLAGLVVFVPLYGAPALLVREVARATGRGWPSVLLLAAAFGVLQAGVVDRSLFSVDYQDYEGWEQNRAATLLAPLGVSAADALNFVAGHVVWSIAAPIAVAEALAPARARQRWLGRRGVVLCAIGWALAAGLILRDSLGGAAPGVSPWQVAGAGVVVVA
ncbi:hypothetical protein, partial [Kineococcus glutinatus]|uniref:hypothetical protein n=1 Tax=Kineococcus glutinatus TaxID=1070872 RepID=UPI0031EEB3B2